MSQVSDVVKNLVKQWIDMVPKEFSVIRVNLERWECT